ncbi:MAG: hypothetical protein IPK44_03185 [Candidatus Accumulibacter sp.]|uniref:hypothetical protein n=1 Tax=Accumulibacter sp. TaxID=2053492 RepID=UPI002584D17C|nr:hypothetical protein [Accumulibacter sp.]MBK8113605.1 hypothetical protein [Accumulibacter sp.]
MVEVMPEDRIARLMTIRDLVAAGQQAPAGPALPDNTMRNNDTGATYSFQSQAPGAAYQADYANPIEIAGAGRGYRIKGDPLAALINGQRVDFGVDGAASRQRQSENLKMQQAQQALQSGALDIQEKQRAAQMGKRPSLPPGYAWSEDGTRAVQIPGLEDVSKPLTEGQSKAAMFGLRMEEADKVLNDVGRDGAVQPGMIKRIGESVPFVGPGLGTALNFTQSPEQQQIDQAQRNFINAILRRESGAVIGQPEFDSANQQYFPQPGDATEKISQKNDNRKQAIAGLRTEAGQRAIAQVQAEYAGLKKPTETDKMPKASDHPGKYLTLPDGRVLQSVGGKWVMGGN